MCTVGTQSLQSRIASVLLTVDCGSLSAGLTVTSRLSIELYCIHLLYKLTERNSYCIQVALPTWCIYKVQSSFT